MALHTDTDIYRDTYDLTNLVTGLVSNMERNFRSDFDSGCRHLGGWGSSKTTCTPEASMALTSPGALAPVIALPTAARRPVINPPRRGRYPRGVTSIHRGTRIQIERARDEKYRSDEIQANRNLMEHLEDRLRNILYDMNQTSAELVALEAKGWS